VAVVRLPDYGAAVEVAQALAAGGIAALEFTLTGQGALDAIARARAASEAAGYSGAAASVGAGTVLTGAQARDVVAAGAQFVVTPVVAPEVIAACAAAGVPCLCGAQTATEALAAHNAGAEFVKIFPARLGGPAFIRDLLGPLPFLKLVPTGGIEAGNARAYLEAGAVAVGSGSSLIPIAAVAAGDWDEITRRARALVQAVAA
jgi:2-dehydro-3-deoxyphosphogluconate aldolase/(4S)-4-hydroxy-2-oxoglutarate aldolase